MVAPHSPTHWWDDWLKFTPGWLAFGWAFGNGIWQGIRKWRNVRHKVALGPADDELREALETARTRFEDIVAEGRRAPWFMDEERRETGRRILDLAERRSDETLCAELAKVADAWNEAFALAPGRAAPRVLSTDQPLSPQQRTESARVQEQFGKEADVARAALEHIKAALARLNELQRRMVGLS
ncbi:hypothetical protein [Streptomyces sp. NPDC051554]|uniref:hypothetical protein n=1 Tax=Streptomyces sp. NPDC051554 TaxID=3365656 RepID=UPI0037A84B28